MSIIATAAQTLDVSKTVPLAAHAADGRQAYLIVTAGGPSQSTEGIGAMTGWTPLVTYGGAAFNPRGGVWARDLTDSTPNFLIPINQTSGGWMLAIVDGTDITTAQAAYSAGFANNSTSSVTPPGDSGSGLYFAGVGTQSQVSMSVNPLAATVNPPKTWFGECRGGYTFGDDPGSLVFSLSGSSDYTVFHLYAPDAVVAEEPVVESDPQFQEIVDATYRAFHKAGVSGGFAPILEDTSAFPVHSTLTSPTRAEAQAAIDAASTAYTNSGTGVPQAVVVSGITALDASSIRKKDGVALLIPEGLTWEVTTTETMSEMILFQGGFPQSRTMTISGLFNSYNASVTDPDGQLRLGIWQIGTNSSNGPGGQQVEIIAIDGLNVTLAEPLTQTFVDSVTFEMNDGSKYVERAGISGDLFMNPAHDVDSLIWMAAAYDCWVDGMRSDGTTDDGLAGTGAGQLINGIYVRQSYHCWIHDVDLDNAVDHGDGGNGYGINLGSVPSMILVENCTINRMRHSILLHGSASGNVVKDCWTGNPIHPNFPNGGPTEISFHGYAAANLIINCNSGRIMLIDASQPGPHNVIVYNTIRTGPLTLAGTDTNDLMHVIAVGNDIQGDVDTLKAIHMPSMSGQPNTSAEQRGDIDGPSPVRPFWYGSYNAGTGEYDEGTGDPFAAANGLPAGYYLPTPAEVDLTSVYVSDSILRSQYDPLDVANASEVISLTASRTSVVLGAGTEVVGTGVGTDVNAGAANGLQAQVGTDVGYTEVWTISGVLPTSVDLAVLISASDDMEATDAAALTLTILDGDDQIVVAKQTLGSIAGGESPTIITKTVSL